MHPKEVTKIQKELVGERVLLFTILYLEEKRNGAAVTLVYQHAVALTLDEYFG
jgi:hypothetical protein